MDALLKTVISGFEWAFVWNELRPRLTGFYWVIRVDCFEQEGERERERQQLRIDGIGFGKGRPH